MKSLTYIIILLSISSCKIQDYSLERWHNVSGQPITVSLIDDKTNYGELIAVEETHLILLNDFDVEKWQKSSIEYLTIYFTHYPRPKFKKEETFHCFYPNQISWEELNKFARFPQGIPNNIDLSMIGNYEYKKDTKQTNTTKDEQEKLSIEQKKLQAEQEKLRAEKEKRRAEKEKRRAETLKRYNTICKEMDNQYTTLTGQVKKLKSAQKAIGESSDKAKNLQKRIDYMEVITTKIETIKAEANDYEGLQKKGYTALSYELFKLKTQKAQCQDKTDEESIKKQQKFDALITENIKELEELLKE